ACSRNKASTTRRARCSPRSTAGSLKALIPPTSRTPRRCSTSLAPEQSSQIMRCSNCGFENPDGMKFCDQCTHSLTLICPKCRFENPPGFKFCGQCTAPLSASKIEAAQSIRISDSAADTEALEGERKTVTALFADIKGSMELIEDLDPEEARTLVDPALKL